MTTTNNTPRNLAAKTAFFICLFIMALVVAGNSQNVTKLPDGNYVAVKAQARDTAASYSATGKTFTDTKGNSYPVMVSSKGKLFVIRKSKETGREYRQYLKL